MFQYADELNTTLFSYKGLNMLKTRVNSVFTLIQNNVSQNGIGERSFITMTRQNSKKYATVCIRLRLYKHYL